MEIKDIPHSRIKELIKLCKKDYLDIDKNTYPAQDWWWWLAQDENWEKELEENMKCADRIIGVLDKHKILGFFMYRNWDDGIKLLCWHGDKSIRGNGIMMKIFRDVMKDCKEKNRAVYLDLKHSEVSEMKLAKRQGFTEFHSDGYIHKFIRGN